MRDTLNLVGDGDDLDVIYDVEHAFGIKLTNAEAERTRNVGQLHDLIESKYPATNTRACLSQTAFYRLRKALESLGVQTKITPQTPIVILETIGAHSISDKWKLLSRSASLDLPPLETPFERWELKLDAKNRWWIGALVLVLIAASAIYLSELLYPSLGVPRGWVYLSILFAAAMLVISFLSLRYVIFRNIPRRIHTVGDLARESAGYSFEKLAAAKHGGSPFDRWFALSAILRRISGHKHPITRDTTFFAKQAKSTG